MHERTTDTGERRDWSSMELSDPDASPVRTIALGLVALMTSLGTQPESPERTSLAEALMTAYAVATRIQAQEERQ